MTRFGFLFVGVLGAIALDLACSTRPVDPAQEGSEGADSSTASSSPGTTSLGTGPGTTSSTAGTTEGTTAGTTAGTGTTAGSSTGASSSGEGCNFLCPEDSDSDGGDSCTVLDQDCPAGSKCVWWAPEFGGPRREAAQCVPVSGQAKPFEPCVLNEDYSDDCGPESYCLEVYGTANHGFCAPFIGNDIYDCGAFPGTHPALENGSSFPEACLSFECQPLLPDSCPDGMRCTFYPAWLYASMHCWIVPPEADLPVGAPCDFGECGEGKLCASAEWLPECAGDRCCAEWCDLEAPVCATPGTVCEPFPVNNYHDAPGFETLGACLLPDAL